ncbi:MAG TPA: hypothetical protein C5S51_04805 [Methanosarcinaceae archaeon]|nr:hypothetical protein [Methanosarcinaceae archaeon]
MSGYSIDAISGAFEKTKKALIQPFDFWKWIKLGIIIILLGVSGVGSQSSGNGQQFAENDFNRDSVGPQIEEMFDQIGQFIQQYMTYILIGVIAFVSIILILSYISNIMEFVFVESLVSNQVKFWAYSKKYMGLGFNLFIIRFILGLAALLLFIGGMLPIIVPMLQSPEILNVRLIIGGIGWFTVVVFVLAVIFGIIESFINLSIPLAMYHHTGIIVALNKIYNNTKADWGQIIVYWVIRIILHIVVAIVVSILALILSMIILGILAAIGMLMYFILSGLNIGLFMWLILALYALVVFVIFFTFVLLASVPAPVFIKYHMLTFLQVWYPDARVPFFDIEENMPA